MDSGFSSEEATGQLWAGVWAGRVSCDGFGALRQGLATGFRAVSRGAGRVRFDRWKSSRPFGEHWFLLRRGDPGDALARLERDRERARLLLLRHGILFRELLQKESPGFRGAGIFRALRLMELSGEVMAGRFFAGISGWQFASARAARILAEWEDGDCVWWQNATDPVACTGPRYAAFQDSLPARLPGTRMVYRGHRLVLVARRNGLHLDFHEDPDVWAPADLTPFFLHLLASAAGRRALVVETVNAEPARGCAYEELLLSVGFRPDMNRLVLREYRPAG